MFWYLFFAFIPILVSIVVSFGYKKSVKTNDKAKRTFLFCCGLFMFLIVSLRHREVGSVDSQNYYNNWEMLSGFSFSSFRTYIPESKFETGYLVFVWIFSHIFPEGQSVFVLSAMLFVVALCRFIYINSKDLELSFVMYVCLGLYTFTVQGLRQSMAMSMCLFAIEFAKKRKLLPFLLLVLLATTFHASAVVFLIVYFIYGFTLNIRTGIVALGFTVLMFATSGQIASIGNQLLDREYDTSVESGGFVAVAVYVIILVVAIVFAGKNRKDKDYSFFVIFTYIGMLFYLMRYFEVRIAERISFYFMYGQLIVLPNALSRFDKHVSFVIKSIVIILSILLFAYRLIGDGLVEYRFLWQ